MTIAGLKNTACFTAGTQVVVDEETRKKVYFTDTSELQSFDGVNILFAFAGMTFAAGTVSLTRKIPKRKRNKTKSTTNKNNITRVDDGLISEVDETSKSFSLRKWILLPLLIIATLICGYFALPTTKTVAVSVPKIETKNQLVTKSIEEIQCGDRVLGKNPVLSEEDRKLFGQEPTQETHYEYLFALPRDDETLTYITLLRPRDWLEKLEYSESICEFETQSDTDKSESGICVWLDLPEMGTVGWAQLLSINDNFEIKSGNGNVVTGKFIHTSNNVIDLKIEGQDAPIGCTDNHPFWSVDRQDYIKAGELREGEKVLLYSGETKRVEQKLPRPGPELVYNIEVFGEHVYHVTKDGILVHNVYNGQGGKVPNDLGKAGEARAGIKKNTAAVTVNGKSRIPDGVTKTYIIEVKNVKYQHLSRQILDEMEYAKSRHKKLKLIVDTNTKLSSSLKILHDNGKIKIVFKKLRD
jgi:hypothetical protein